MPFQVGHTLWKRGLETRREQANRTAELLGMLVDYGSEKYGDKMAQLADGEAISEPEEQFMDRLERLIEFRVPKLARQEHTGANGAPLSLAVVHYGAPEALKISELDPVKVIEVPRAIEPISALQPVKTARAKQKPKVEQVKPAKSDLSFLTIG